MNYELILNNIASVAIALGVLFPRLLLRWGGIGYKLSATCFLVAIICKALGLQYAFSVSAVVIISLAAASLFVLGMTIENKPWEKKEG